MTKKLILAFCLGLTLLACSKSNETSNRLEDGRIAASQVPAQVMNAFNARYPSAAGQIEWEIEHGSTYKVKFFIGSQRWEAQFATSGSFIDEKMIS